MPEKWFPHLSGYRGWNTKHGHRGAGWRSFSGGEGNDKAIVKRIFIRETWRNQRQDKKERGTSRFSRIPLYKDSHRTPVRDGGRNGTLSGRRPIPIYCQAAEKHPSAALLSPVPVSSTGQACCGVRRSERFQTVHYKGFRASPANGISQSSTCVCLPARSPACAGRRQGIFEQPDKN